MQITKRNGKVVMFDTDKIAQSILKANEGEYWETISAKKAAALADEVFAVVTAENEIITTKNVHDAVCKVLKEHFLTRTAEKYAAYVKTK